MVLHLLLGKEGFAPLEKILDGLHGMPAVPREMIAEALASSAELVVATGGSGGAMVRRKSLAEKICSHVEWQVRRSLSLPLSLPLSLSLSLSPSPSLSPHLTSRLPPTLLFTLTSRGSWTPIA